MNINELLMKLETIRSMVGDVEVKIMINGVEQDVEIAVMGDNRVVLVPAADATFIPDDTFQALVDDFNAWSTCHKEDLWIFDKLILSRKLSYSCGPKGMDVPEPGMYVVRPCINLLGMGRGASIEFIEEETLHLPDGHFWCEKFEGRHLSVDYEDGLQVLCVEGIRASDSLSRWELWEKTCDVIPFPKILKSLTGSYKHINVEFIGNRIIEVHLRQNPDFMGIDANHIIPVYEKEERDGYYFKEDRDHDRLGFLIPLTK